MTTGAQNKRVLAHLRENKRGLTSFQAFHMGITRLAARIYDLKEMGHEINTVMEPNGNGGKHGRYVLIKEAG